MPDNAQESSPWLLEAQGLVKEYPGVRALDGVELRLRVGEALGLCGENGAGKSTLLKILSGSIPGGQYSGRLFWQGKPMVLSHPGQALDLGIRIIHQELALAPDLTVTENIFLGQELGYCGGQGSRRFFSRLGFIDRHRQDQEARNWLQKLGLAALDPDMRVGELPVGLRQGVEIARALRGGGKLLILDEPTSALSQKESAALLSLCAKLKEQGLGLIYVSHKLGEVFQLADSLVILRNGRTSGHFARPPFVANEVSQAMVGRNLGEVFPEPPPLPKDAKLALSVHRLSLRRMSSAKIAVQPMDFNLREGEILGLAGLLGAGRSEIMEALFGLPGWMRSGQIRYAGKAPQSLAQHPREAMSQGLALLPEDRRRHGLHTDLSLRHNHSLAALAHYTSHVGWIDQKREKSEAEAAIHRFRIKASHGEALAATLSGGNQQKVVLAKWLLTRPRVLFLDDPTRGVDIGGKAEIYRLIVELASQGLAILLASSENEEVLSLSHRVLVLREGQALGEYARGELDNAALVALCSSPWKASPSPESTP